ncbi:hypothetical protein [Pelosinus propionicus]|uniref:Uncharacterized protein n=1 Tax=Pelosinus propionicus DSM 13327 TaxID=1123291 RepID=A0A1I4JI94_9FIRM|nr:hypothetical protein [Pelosinus propionicus]SFL65917.1 hypothetical protein SAMN04490355_101286 [Pelosinus propionicus DSM 13327]
MEKIVKFWKDAVWSKIIATAIWENKGALVTITVTIISITVPWLRENWYIPTISIAVVLIIFLSIKNKSLKKQVKSVKEENANLLRQVDKLNIQVDSLNIQNTNLIQESSNIKNQINSTPPTGLDWLKKEDLSCYEGLFWFKVKNSIKGRKSYHQELEDNPQFRKLLNNGVLTKIQIHGYEITPEIFDYLDDEFNKLDLEHRKELIRLLTFTGGEFDAYFLA